MPVLGERGDDDVGDVVDVDERLPDVAGGQGDDALLRRRRRACPSVKFCVNQLARTIVCSSPESDDDPLARLGAVLAAAGEQHEPLDAGVGRRPG